MTQEERKMMEEILDYLKNGELASDDDDDYIFGRRHLEDSEKGDIAIGNANVLFITDGGRPNFDMIMAAWKEYGIDVTSGDRDDFGWLTGICSLGSDRERCFVFG